MPANSLSELERQIRLSKMLATGFALSLVGAGGFGSLAALLIGVKALITITRASTKLAGIWMTWWCIIVGGIGAIVLLPFTFSLLIHSNK
jgi:hypothetical protein